ASCGFIGAVGKAFVHGRGFVSADVLDAAAGALGLDSAELMGQLAEGNSLEEIAGTQDVAYDTVKSATIAALESDLDAAVDQGVDQVRADSVVQRVQTWLDEGGQGGFGRFGGRFGHGERPYGNH
ncbi:MAG TPA: hypothetical protein VES36_00540, partial [Candidatus Limnocylindrales bacterium]|nr:hypothetical protein [Candidatus Limnocylindrales bacterium]